MVRAVSVGLQDETEVDWRATFSAGAPVFRSPGRRLLFGGRTASGAYVDGSIVIADVPDVDTERVFAHERVHLLQGDFAFLAWSEPVEAWLADRSAVTRAIYRYVDAGFVLPLAGIVIGTVLDVDYRDRPHEIEARFLEGQ
jgi:hypothetical protein